MSDPPSPAASSVVYMASTTPSVRSIRPLSANTTSAPVSAAMLSPPAPPKMRSAPAPPTMSSPAPAPRLIDQMTCGPRTTPSVWSSGMAEMR